MRQAEQKREDVKGERETRLRRGSVNGLGPGSWAGVQPGIEIVSGLRPIT
jgi:hypothetical protein